MAKDCRGLELKADDVFLFQGLMFIVKNIKEGNIIGGLGISKDKVQGQIIPGTVTCEVKFDFNPSVPIPNIYKLAPVKEEDA